MATKTPNLGLIKPAYKEYNNSWYIPVNANWDILDATIGGTALEVQAARGSQASLDARLAVGINADGTLKATPEVGRARVSTIYGNLDSARSIALFDRIEGGDRESFDARMGSTTLQDAIAFAADDDVHNCVLSAPGGYLSFTGAVVKVDGSVTPVVTNINGFRRVVRTLKSTTVAGIAGTYYIYLQKTATGDVVVDRTGGGQNTGAIALWGFDSTLRKFSDSTQNFVTLGVQPGDIIEVTSVGSLNKDKYVVSHTNVTNPGDLTVNEIAVVGLFVTTQTALNYKITNPLAPTLATTITAHTKRFQRENGLIYIGRAVFDGANVTSISITYATKGRFEAWQSVVPAVGDFLNTFTHNLGYIPTKIELYASQANDYSAAIEPLAAGQLTAGAQTLTHAVIVDITETTIRVKNATNGIYYKDFAGVSQTAGFLLCRVER